MSHHRQQGFSAVELLITLFVAAGFLVAGYQLYFIIIKDNGQTRAQSRAANVAYNYLRQYAPTVSAPCSPTTPLTNSSVTVSGLTNVTISVIITCPYSSSTGTNSAINISRVEADVTYGNPSTTLKYATFTHDTPNAATATDVTSGIVGWWKLDGTAQASVGVDGTVNGATLTTGQGGVANSAYSFNGTSNTISAQITNTGGDYVHSISVWLYPTSIGSANDPVSIGTAATNSYSALELRSASTYWYNYNNDVSYSSALPTNAWSLVTLTYSGGGATTTNKKMYINGSVVSTSSSGANYGQVLTLPTTSTVGIGYDWGRSTSYFTGKIDDLRVYNRVLTPTEITTIYNNGAQ